MAFSKLNTKPRPIEVLEQIISALEAGEYTPGEKLPPERDLAEVMGVSRTSIREALSILHTVGVIERQQGSGTYVKCVDPSAFERAWLVLEESEVPHEIFEWQQIVEPAIAVLAAQRAKKSDLKAMETALEAMRKSLLSNATLEEILPNLLALLILNILLIPITMSVNRLCMQRARLAGSFSTY